jgi:hypothetical protein
MLKMGESYSERLILIFVIVMMLRSYFFLMMMGNKTVPQHYTK